MDVVLPFQLETSPIRGRITRLDAVIRRIISQHTYPALINRYLSETIALAVAVSNCFKFDGLFTLQIMGDGPVRLMVVDVSSEGSIRACARLKEPDHPLFITETQATVQQLFGGGHLAFTIDQTNADDRYQGVVDLTGETLSQCMHHFFRQSEQLETGIVIASHDFTIPQEKMPLVSALMVQRLPLAAGDDQEESDDLWVKTLSSLGTLSAAELLSPDLNLNDILYRLFWEEGVRLYKEKNLHFRCRCSQSKIHGLLKTFSAEDLKEMVVDDKIQVNCEFCNEKYEFTLESVYLDTAT